MLKSIRLAVALALLAGPAFAQSKTLTVAAYGGVWDSHLREKVFPDFEKKHGVKVDYVAGNSTDTLAKLQAQKGNQVIDVAIMDDGVMYQAIQLGFCTKIEGMDKSELYPAALFKDDKAVAVGQTGTASWSIPRPSRKKAGRSRPRGTISRIRSSRSSS